MDWRLVNDLSAGSFSLTSMVDHQLVTSYPMDNLAQLGELLMKNHHQNSGKCFVVWKSDIREAYRICPMHVLWQIKQAIRIQGRLRIEQVNMFGGSASEAIFIALNTLVAWIEKYEELIESLVYVDDSFRVEEEGMVERYELYEESYPTSQAHLLKLWDKVGIPHKKRKKISGERLMVLGIEVDTNNLLFALPKESKGHLEKVLEEWSQKGVQKRVKEWQQLAGWINWAFNIFPLLQPALNNVYAKLKGK